MQQKTITEYGTLTLPRGYAIDQCVRPLGQAHLAIPGYRLNNIQALREPTKWWERLLRRPVVWQVRYTYVKDEHFPTERK